MNALECADWLEAVSTGLSANECAAMLRKQAEAIKVLREALTELSWYAGQMEMLVYCQDEQGIDHEIQAKAKQALKDTEEFK